MLPFLTACLGASPSRKEEIDLEIPQDQTFRMCADVKLDNCFETPILLSEIDRCISTLRPHDKE